MGWLGAMVGALATLALVLLPTTRLLTRRIEARFPPVGAFAEVGGRRLHYIDVADGPGADLAPMVFLHGAAGNARDLFGAFGQCLAGRARMVFLDRPGAGYSQRAHGDAAPDAQAGQVAGLMEQLGIERAVIVGHSLGGAVAAAFAVDHPARTAGLVLIAPASHPWPGARISWYNRLASRPMTGRLFAHLVAIPFGHLRYASAVRAVFAPDRPPGDYARRSATRLVLRPAAFRHNAADLCQLHGHVRRLSPRYGAIAVPTVIITGDSDAVVPPERHAVRLAGDIAGARLVWLRQAGHMPTYSHTEAIVAEIERLNGRIAPPAQMPERPSLAT
ncbi:MAG: esterase [Alphaproteobacteria bacterium]|nr:MAG: esterase [Alphaproteobacteria bacterium]